MSVVLNEAERKEKQLRTELEAEGRSKNNLIADVEDAKKRVADLRNRVRSKSTVVYT